MSKQSRGKSWLDFRLADRLETPAGDHTAELVARRGTGVSGFRMTVVFMPRDGGRERKLELENAASTADVHRRARELTGDVARLVTLFEESEA